MQGIVKHGLPAEFGNGSDGVLNITSNTAIDQHEYNLTELTIATGYKLYAPVTVNLSSYHPYVIIRCQTPIVLTGTGYIDMGSITGRLNYTLLNKLTGGEADLVRGDDPSHHYHITGGAGAGGTPLYTFGASGQAQIGYSDDQLASGEDGSAAFSGTPGDEIPKWVGPSRLYRFALGGIGGIGGNEISVPYGGRGGGCLEIWAPDLIVNVGAGASIRANGGNGENGADEGGPGEGAGGGGGGCVMIFTSTLANIDLTEVDVTGGAGGTGVSGGSNGGDGLDGMKFWRQINTH